MTGLSTPFGPERASGRLAAALVLAAAVAAAAQAIVTFEHGWWLVAYLVLVGGLAQLLLSPGAGWLASRTQAPRSPARRRWWAIGLWNTGAVAVPAGVLTSDASLVLAGSLLLLAALAVFATDLRWTAGRARYPAPAWKRAQCALIVFLAVSVLVGAHLGNALPFR